VTGRLAKRYARALLALAREEKRLEAIGEELERAVGAFEEPRLRPLLLSPVIDARTRLATTREVTSRLGLSPIVTNLVSLLAERDRLVLLTDVAHWYGALLDAELGRARVTIRSAAPLSGTDRDDLVQLARRLTGRREVIATTEVDPELLGGVVLDVAGTVYDGSLRAGLARLAKEMARDGA
jgi:F-type H+-transporting ATPase subunit delta